MVGYIYSAESNFEFNPEVHNCSTTGMAGTSMATPAAAACGALIREYFQDGFYPLGIPEPGFSYTPTGALIKAVLINSCDNMTGSYTGDSGSAHGDIPTNGQGWGRIHLDNALYFEGDVRKLYIDDNRDGLNTGDSQTYYIVSINSEVPFEVTLVWTDYPSNPSAQINLVNDLDLTVTHNGTVYKGNVYQNGESIPGGDYDRLNPVECVQINNPENGLYEITVTGYNVPQGPQPYALVVTGALSFSDGVISLDRGKYNCSDIFTVTVSDADLIGNGTQDITIQTESHPEQTYTLTEEPPNSGVFRGTFETTTSEPGPNQIRVSEGDTLTVTYIDEDNGHGGYNVPKTDTALIDCTGPQISNVNIIEYHSDSVTIYWETDELSNSVVEYGETPDLGNTEEVSTFTTQHEVTLTGLTQCTDYYFLVRSTDEAMNEAVDDNNGNLYTFTTYAVYLLIDEPLDEDPGWDRTGDWQFGAPQGSCYDPDSAYTGTNVFGYNLSGCYQNAMSEQYLTTGPINCSSAVGTKLYFYRWLSVESSTFDHAKIEISNDGGNTWQTVWNHSSGTVMDSGWTLKEFDISEWADGHQDVRIRWVMGPTDYSVTYGGWNIDDISISYEAPCNAPNLMYESHIIDDSNGNNNGMIDYGESISMPVTLENLGLDATNVVATLQTDNPYVEITQDTCSFGDIPQGGSAEANPPYYQFNVSSDAPDGEQIVFTLIWQSNEGSGVTSFIETIHTPDIEYSSNMIYDPTGDQDLILDPGETANLLVEFSNIGSGDAYDLVGTLSSDHPEYITIIDGESDIEVINGGGTGWTVSPHFQIMASPNTPDPTTITFTVDILGSNGFTDQVSFTVDVTTSNYARRYFWNLDSDPGWTTEGGWEFGVPQGSCSDPTSGYTGTNVYGYNLNGCYPNNMSAESLITTPIDCSNLSNVTLKFMRWLGVERNYWDHAYVYVSNDGTNWTLVWENPNSSIQDTSWTEQEFDISAVADGQPTVYIKWVMGPTDSSVTFSGWNIDDIEIWAESSGPQPTWTPTEVIYTPTPTSIPTDTPTPLPTNTPTPLPTDTPTPLPTDTPTPIPTFTPTEAPTNTPTNTPTLPPPTNTPIPPTATPVPPTNTPVPPTSTPIPPTNTPIPSTNTPVPPTNTPTTVPTVPPNPIFLNFIINQEEYHPGDFFKLELYIKNYNGNISGIRFIVLEYEGEYWFYPSWSQDIDYENVNYPENYENTELILSFNWPQWYSDLIGITFYSLITDLEMQQFYSNLATVTFNYYKQ